MVDQELELGLRSLAVPLHDPRGQVVAAMNVSTHVSRGSTQDVVRDLLPALRETATSIEADLRVRLPRPGRPAPAGQCRGMPV